ncbi:hypothetical protein Tco_1254921 [Tanacetum coccineum]
MGPDCRQTGLEVDNRNCNESRSHIIHESMVVSSDEDLTDQEEDLHEASSDIEKELYKESNDQEEFYDEDSSDLEEYLGMFDETDQEEVCLCFAIDNHEASFVFLIVFANDNHEPSDVCK